MKTQTALTLAIEALIHESQTLSVHANLFNHYGLKTPVTRSAAERRADIDEAIITLQDLKDILKEMNYAE
jgi:hypothetical protein